MADLRTLGTARPPDTEPPGPNVVTAVVYSVAAELIEVIVPSFDDEHRFEVDSFIPGLVAGDVILIAFDENGQPWQAGVGPQGLLSSFARLDGPNVFVGEQTFSDGILIGTRNLYDDGADLKTDATFKTREIVVESTYWPYITIRDLAATGAGISFQSGAYDYEWYITPLLDGLRLYDGTGHALTFSKVTGGAGKPGIAFGDALDVAVFRDAAGVLKISGALTLGTDLAVSEGGTGASSAAAARTNLGLIIGTDVQGHNATLDALAALTTTVFGRDFLALADAAAARTKLALGSLATLSAINDGNWSGTDLAVVNGGTGASDAGTARANLGLIIGTNVQAYGATLDALAALTTTTFGRSLLTQADASAALTALGVSTFIKTLLDDADAATARTTLGISGVQAVSGISGGGTATASSDGGVSDGAWVDLGAAFSIPAGLVNLMAQITGWADNGSNNGIWEMRLIDASATQIGAAISTISAAWAASQHVTVPAVAIVKAWTNPSTQNCKLQARAKASAAVCHVTSGADRGTCWSF